MFLSFGLKIGCFFIESKVEVNQNFTPFVEFSAVALREESMTGDGNLIFRLQTKKVFFAHNIALWVNIIFGTNYLCFACRV